MKKIAFFSTGAPDPSQGGSGIINFHILKKLVEKKYIVDCFFLSSKSFLKKHTTSNSLKYFDGHVNKISFFHIKPQKSKKFSFFYSYLKSIHNVDFCKNVVDGITKKYYGYISLDLGWAIALKKKYNVVSILGDPYHSRILHGHNESILKKIKASMTNSGLVIKKIGKELNSKKRFLLSFSKNHADDYWRKGLQCSQFNVFTEFFPKNKVKKNFRSKSTISLVHLGDLGTTASRKNISFLKKSINILSKKTEKKIIINFIGRNHEKKDILNCKNVSVRYLGFVKNLSNEIVKNDAVISVADYPVGTRTRLVTAMSLGMPCIAHVSSSLGLHQLKNGNDILFCNDEDDFVNQVLFLASNIKKQKEISRNARASWLKYFNPKINVQRLLDKINC